MKGVLPVGFDMIRRKERAEFIRICSKLGITAQCCSNKRGCEVFLLSGLLLSHNPYLRWRKWSEWSPEVPVCFTFLYHIWRNVLSRMICICVLEEQGKNPTNWWESLLLNCGQDVSSRYQCYISARLTMDNCTEIGVFHIFSVIHVL